VAGADPGHDHAQALCEAAVTLAERGHAQAIVAVTRGGDTARRLSALRPRVSVVAATDSVATARRLSLSWGVVPVTVDIGENVEGAGPHVCGQLVGGGLLQPGTPVVLVSINPEVSRPDANYLKIHVP
jgi:pyruvate kinase